MRSTRLSIFLLIILTIKLRVMQKYMAKILAMRKALISQCVLFNGCHENIYLFCVLSNLGGAPCRLTLIKVPYIDI